MAKILLVEDDTNLSEIYQARMEAEGYEVVAASDGETALAVAAKEKPDLIISDVMMPKISGFEMLDILRNTEELKNTPVIMLTALGQTDDKGRAERLGADRYLVKSQVTLEDIVNAAHAILQDGANTEVPAEVATASAVDTTPQPIAPEVTPQPVAVTPEAAAPATDTPVQPAEPSVVAMPVAAAPPADDATATDQPQPATDVPTVTPPADDSTQDDAAATDSDVAAPATTDAAPAPAPTPAPHRAEGYEHRPIVPVRVSPVTAPVARQTPQTEQQPAEAPAASQPAAEEPATQPAPPSVDMDEGVVDHAINQLLSKSPQQPQSQPVHGQVLSSDVSNTATSEEDKPLKKVISPITKPPVASLDELLAREEARDGVTEAAGRNLTNLVSDPELQPPAPAAEPAPQAAIPTPEDTPQPAPAPDATDNTTPPPPAPKPPIDPNSIAL